MVYLVVGLDRNTLRPWHENVRARDAVAAEQIARSRAATAGVDLLVAGAIGPNGYIAVGSRNSWA